MELKHYFRMLLAGWWIIALAGLAGLSLALAFSYMQIPTYRTSARLLVRPSPAISNASNLVDSLSTLDKRSIVSTYAEISKSNRLYNDATTSLGLTASQLMLYVRSTVALPDSNILEVSVEGPDPQMTAVIVNNLSQRTVDYVNGLNQGYSVDFLDPAVTPASPISPQPVRDASLALVLGFLFGSILAILREQIRTPLELLQKRTMYDNGSGAYTCRYFQRRLKDEMASARGNVSSLGFIELKGLADLEDTLPQSILDRLLRQVTSILKSELRGGDSVGRWDETTFSVLLPATPEDAAKRTLERIRAKLSIPQPLEGMDGDAVNLQPQVGNATIEGNETVSALIQRAKLNLGQDRQNLGMSPRR